MIENTKIDSTLQFVAQRGWRDHGDRFFKALVEFLAETLELEYAFVDRVDHDSPKQAKTVALYAQGNIRDNIVYDLAGTPCEEVIGASLCCYQSRIQHHFPDDDLLLNMQAESYAGIPLRDSSNRVIGLIAVMGCSPLEDESTVKSVLQIAAVRASAELERNQSETLLREQEQQVRLFLEETEDLVARFSTDGIIEYVNHASVSFFGLEAEQIVGKPAEFGMHPDDIRQAQLEIASWKASEQNHFTYTSRILNTSGDTVWLNSKVTRVENEQGEVVCYWCTARDITENVKTQKSLRESETYFRSLFMDSTLPMALAEADSGILVECNHALETMVARSQEELIGQPQKILHPVEDFVEDSDVSSTFAQHRTDSNLEILMGKILTSNGDIRDVEIKAAQVKLNGKRYILGMFNDLTDHIEAEHEREQLKWELSQAQKMESVGRLAGGVAHDFNNMLGVIIGHVELAREYNYEVNKMPGIIESISNAAERSVELTQQLLAFARKQQIVPQVVQINQTIESSIKMLSRLIGENVSLNWAPAADLSPVHIDPAQVGQILTNLCVNARDAIADVGEINIRTGMVNLEEDPAMGHPAGHYVELTIEDTGEGISDEDIPQIFEPFYSTKEAGRGTGLGLATVHGIIKQNKGHISVLTEQGKGTCFKILFPAIPGAGHSEVKDSTEPQAQQGSGSILLVEDELQLLKLTREILEQLGYTVYSAPTPVAGIELFKRHQNQIDLLISDVIMPGMNGVELSQKLQAEKPVLKVILMSGYPADTLEPNFLEKNTVFYLDKPVTISKLSSCILEALNLADEDVEHSIEHET